MYACAFFEDFVLLYPVYALLFADAGLSTAQISSLFVIWSLTGLALEVPSGVWADAFSRRLLLVASPLLTGAGFALWTWLPSYPAFAAGFVLWGLATALRSGTLQALVYEELQRIGTASCYARLIGRAQAIGVTAIMVANAAAAPVMGVGGYRALGSASVATCVVCAAIAWTLPESRERGRERGGEPDGGDDTEDVGDGSSMAAVWRDGWAHVRTAPGVRGGVVLLMVVMGCSAVDEYVPVLARSTGVAVAAVPLLVLVVSAGETAGGWLAGRDTAWLNPALAVAGVCLAVGALWGRPAGMVLVAVAFGVTQWAIVAAETRLQERIADRSRATVMSLAGLGSEVMAVLAYAGYGLGSAWAGPGVLFAVAALPYLVVAVVRRVHPEM
ncbi:MFS transporter [Actinomadura barringtoniae]|uniref:MFS transporter n=1 Tax=Actinomadura barringtoniae TaxID=1427535 RepID=UPI0027DD5CDF|nr:MFS transporter [Actinomadura barringtoniae]